MLTAKQWRMLEILDRHGGEGTMEVRLQFGDYDFGDTEADNNKSWNVNNLVVSAIMRSLVRKGYASDDENGYDITESGRELLQRERERRLVVELHDAYEGQGNSKCVSFDEWVHDMAESPTGTLSNAASQYLRFVKT
jgi:DNA-binding MarR family transcriptional regulator